MRRQKTIDDVINFILANAPLEGEVCTSSCFPVRKFEFDLVDPAIRLLHAQGRFLDLEAYDIKRTKYMWNTSAGIMNYELARIGTKKLIRKLQEQREQSLEELLPTITKKDFCAIPINRYGTTLGGMLNQVYCGSPYAALIDLIRNDAEFEEYYDFQPYDMSCSPEWTDELARTATKKLIKVLQEQINPNLEELLPTIQSEDFHKVPINRYGTTLGGMLDRVYCGSPYAALIDLINHDDSFVDYRDLQPYDMSCSPKWTDELAREATKKLIKKLQKQGQKLEELLPTIQSEDFHKFPINRYGTTLGGMLDRVYCSSPYAALIDLINHDDSLVDYRDLQPYDMSQSPIWTDELARTATKKLIRTLQEERQPSLEQLLPTITFDKFITTPINRYGTTLRGMLNQVYCDSPYAALMDLAENDPEFTPYIPIIEQRVRRINQQ